MIIKWKWLYYYGIGCVGHFAAKNGSISTLVLTILALFIGLIWVFPIFLPEEKSDKKL